MCCRISHTSTHFNSRPSARGDQLQPVQGEGWHISIHAPPRGATRSAACASRHAQFQFTPLREGRPHSAAVRCFSAAFQFTPLREGRLVMPQGRTRGGISIHAPPRGATHTPHKPWHGRHFNSRPSARGDRTPTAGSAGGRISIHAPPRGATEYAIGRVVETNFNSRPSARGDMTLAIFLRPSIFQFTPLREGRLIPFPAPAVPTEFQFTPLREGRR